MSVFERTIGFRVFNIFVIIAWGIACFDFLQYLDAPLISDALLKYWQGFSYKSLNYSSLALVYPAKDLDPFYHFFLWQPPMALSIGESSLRYSQYPPMFSLLTSFFLGKTAFYSWRTFLFLLNGFSIFWLYQWVRESADGTNFREKFPFHSVFGISFLCLGSMQLLMSLDYSENIFIFLSSSWFIYTIARKEIEPNRLAWSSFFLGLSVWFRLEPVILFALWHFWNFVWKKGKVFERSFFLSIILFAIPVIPYLVWNQIQFGHFLGPRFYMNYETDSFSFLALLKKVMAQLIYSVEDKTFMGYFSLQPYFLLPLVSFCFQGYRRHLPDWERKLYYLWFSSILALCILAPNDGVTLKARYLVVTLFLGWVLTIRSFQRSRKGLPINALSGLLLISVAWILFTFSIMTKGSLQILKPTFEKVQSLESDLIVFSSNLFCGYASTEHLHRKILCYQDQRDKELLLSILQQYTKKGKSFAFIEGKNFDQLRQFGFFPTWKEDILPGFKNSSMEFSRDVSSRHIIITEVRGKN